MLIYLPSDKRKEHFGTRIIPFIRTLCLFAVKLFFARKNSLPRASEKKTAIER